MNKKDLKVGMKIHSPWSKTQLILKLEEDFYYYDEDFQGKEYEANYLCIDSYEEVKDE